MAFTRYSFTPRDWPLRPIIQVTRPGRRWGPVPRGGEDAISHMHLRCIHTNIEREREKDRERERERERSKRRTVTTPPPSSHPTSTEASEHESTILSFPTPTCIAHPGAILLHDYWAVSAPTSDIPFVYHTPDTIGHCNIVQRPIHAPQMG